MKWESLPAEWGLNDPRKRAHREMGAIGFACGEGVHIGAGEVYFVCTSGGAIKSGQIMRYDPDPADGQRGTLQLFLESVDPRSFNFGDNLTVAPNGHLIVCEDPYFGGEGNFALREVADVFGTPAPCRLRGSHSGRRRLPDRPAPRRQRTRRSVLLAGRRNALRQPLPSGAHLRDKRSLEIRNRPGLEALSGTGGVKDGAARTRRRFLPRHLKNRKERRLKKL